MKCRVGSQVHQAILPEQLNAFASGQNVAGDQMSKLIIPAEGSVLIVSEKSTK
jgi:hypothetical protein